MSKACSLSGRSALQQRIDLLGEVFERDLALDHLAIDEEGRRRIDLQDLVGELLVGGDLVEQRLILQTILDRLLGQAGLTQQAVEDCLKDQALLDKIAADQKFANEVLKVNSTPTFFINGEMVKGEQSFEEFSKRINSMLKS